MANIKKIIYTVHNLADKEQSLISGLYSKNKYRNNKIIPVGISPIVTESICKRYKLQKVDTIFNGIYLDKYIPKRDYTIEENIVILNIARFAQQKNHIRLLRVFKHILSEFSNATLRLIGEGELLEKVKSEACRLGIENHVEFYGIREDIEMQMNKADIFVLSSDYEGMPITLIEAMASAIPIVSTNVGGIPDMLEDEISAMLTECDELQMAQAIISLLKDKSKRQRLGNAALINSKKFSNITMAKKYEKIYEKSRGE